MGSGMGPRGTSDAVREVREGPRLLSGDKKKDRREPLGRIKEHPSWNELCSICSSASPGGRIGGRCPEFTGPAESAAALSGCKLANNLTDRPCWTDSTRPAHVAHGVHQHV